MGEMGFRAVSPISVPLITGQGMWYGKRLSLLHLDRGYLWEKTVINPKTYLCLLLPLLGYRASMVLGRCVWSWKRAEFPAIAAWPHSGSQLLALQHADQALLGKSGK